MCGVGREIMLYLYYYTTLGTADVFGRTYDCNRVCF